jgi:hypothetical protein
MIMLAKCKTDNKMREHTDLNQRTNTRTQQLHVVRITNTMESIFHFSTRWWKHDYWFPSSSLIYSCFYMYET